MEQKYRDVFKEVFGVQENILNDTFSKNSVKDWDSVHQLNIIASLEDAFDIMFDPEDIMDAMYDLVEEKKVEDEEKEVQPALQIKSEEEKMNNDEDVKEVK